MVTYRYTGSVPSDISHVCQLVAEQIQILRAESLISADQLMDLRLIMSELMINGCEHGNNNDASKRVYLELCITGAEIRVLVRDEGKGFTMAPPSQPTRALSCGGRGLRIVHELSDSMIVDKNTVLCMLRREEFPAKGR